MKQAKLFEEISLGDKDVDFTSFQIFLRSKCGLKEISFLEIDELFQFVDSKGDESIQKDEFLKIFNDVKPLDPVAHNRAYFQKLSSRQQEYYKKKYKIDISKQDASIPGLVDYRKIQDEDELYEYRKEKKAQEKARKELSKKEVTQLLEKDQTRERINAINNSKA